MQLLRRPKQQVQLVGKVEQEAEELEALMTCLDLELISQNF